VPSGSPDVPAALAPTLPHVDLVERLHAVPEGAAVRGVHFKALMQAVDRRGLRPAFDQTFPYDDFSIVRTYPVGDYLVRLAYAGSLATSPAEVHEGMRLLMHDNATFFAHSLFGKSLIWTLGRSPQRVLSQAIIAKRSATNYGKWTLIEHGPQAFEVKHEDEYVWIASALTGGAVGMVEACGLTPVIEVKMVDRFNGSTWFRW
jgi:uncharacterized protein (TIGR02265 family)